MSHFGVCLFTGNIELLRYLISKSVDVNSESDAGSPLIWAAGHDQPDAVKVLLEHHANVSHHLCFSFQCNFLELCIMGSPTFFLLVKDCLNLPSKTVK